MSDLTQTADMVIAAATAAPMTDETPHEPQP
jgi:hypothetical protein